jgi:thioredoxin 1
MKVLKIGAKWCPECQVMVPRWKEIEEELDWLETEYYDFDENEEMAEQYNIKVVPTFIFLDSQGEEIKRLTGEISKKKLISVINEVKSK